MRREEEDKERSHTLYLSPTGTPAPSSLIWEEEKEKENRRRRFWVE
jgi:hypothetical protein